MTELHVLIAGFFLTFSFLGYKLAGFIKKTLDSYSKNIEMKINNAEMLKLKSVQMFEEADNRSKTIEKEIEKMQYEAEEKIKNIKDKFKTETETLLNNMHTAHLEKIDNETNDIIAKMREKITACIEDNINDFVEKNISKEQKDNAMVKILAKVDFKKMFS